MGHQLGFGLIGCGRVAPSHVFPIKELNEAKLVAVCDVIEERAENFAATFEADPYTDYHKLLERDDIDVINVCTPSGLHAAIAIDAMLAGKHVIVEKPMALSLDDADAMTAAADQAGVKLCVVFQNRHNPPMQDVHKALREGRLGELYLGNATVRWHRTQEYYEDGWHGTWAMDGGVLMNQSIHHIDALLWLMDKRAVEVFAYSGHLAHEMEAEDTAVVVIRFEDGALASIEGSTIIYPTDLEGSVAIFGQRGSVKIGGTALNRKVMWKIEGELEQEASIIGDDTGDPASVYGSSHRHVIADMIAAIKEDRPPYTGGPAGKKPLALILAAYESARTGKPVKPGA